MSLPKVTMNSLPYWLKLTFHFGSASGEEELVELLLEALLELLCALLLEEDSELFSLELEDSDSVDSEEDSSEDDGVSELTEDSSVVAGEDDSSEGLDSLVEMGLSLVTSLTEETEEETSLLEFPAGVPPQAPNDKMAPRRIVIGKECFMPYTITQNEPSLKHGYMRA